MYAHQYFVNRIYELLIDAGLATWQRCSRRNRRPVLVLKQTRKPVSWYAPGDLLDLLWAQQAALALDGERDGQDPRDERLEVVA